MLDKMNKVTIDRDVLEAIFKTLEFYGNEWRTKMVKMRGQPIAGGPGKMVAYIPTIAPTDKLRTDRGDRARTVLARAHGQ